MRTTSFSVSFLSWRFLRTPQSKGGGGGRAPKNLKVLKPGTDIRATMTGYTQALGVRCTHCHVQANPPDSPSDENPKKETARHMIAMLQQINANFADGKDHVTCYTCHNGAVKPKTAPEATAAAAPAKQ
jgi:hypothetical protein